MAYDNTTQLVTAPIGVYDVQRAVGKSSPDVGTLCLANTINMWARYKPIKYASIAQLTAAQWNEKRHGVYRSTNLPLFDNNSRLNHDVWTYDRPTGGAESPYRLTDFLRYYHIAPCPINIIFPGDVLTISTGTVANKIGFTVTFEQGIGRWRSDDCCLYMRDIFENASLAKYVTVGLIHYVTGNYIGYFMSSDNTLSSYIASQADAQHLAGIPAVNVLVDMADFKSNVASQYLAAGTKWQAVVFLSDYQQQGTIQITTGETELLQYDGTVTQDSDGYEEGCDRHIMTITEVTWVDSITGMTITTTYTKDGANTYKISQVVLTVTRASNLPAWSFDIICEAICIGGSMSNNGQQSSGVFTPYTISSISFAANATTASVTLLATNFTGYEYNFRELSAGNVSRAILRVGIVRTGGEMSLATDADCSSGQSTITATNNL